MRVRELSPKQEAALDRLAERDPMARVIGWSYDLRGPRIRLYDGKVKVMSATAYLRKEPV